MDRSEKKKNSKRHSGKKHPRVPIKTYKWEDVRRARRKGGYPWTYLYKEAFNESIHPENFRMDGLRKNKTSSASSVSDSLEIREITEDDIKGLEGIDSSYVVIESPILLGVQMDEAIKDQEGIIESADSSDNISQYLDKEERGPEQQLESTETLTLPGPSTPEVSNGRQTGRAKSEEPKRKRKLSVDSNYSRISLSKLGVMKRLKDAKEKIKLPKFSSKSNKETDVKNKQESKQEEEPKHVHKLKAVKNEKPVYIHIPLRPPEGEKDEFSHLEFEEKPSQASQPIPEVQIEATGAEKSEKDEENIQDIVEEKSEVVESKGNNLTFSATNENHLSLKPPNDQEDDVSAIIFLEGEEGIDNKEEYDIIAVDIDENSQEMKMSQITNNEVRRQVLESIKKVDSQPNISGNKEDPSVNLSRSSSKASKISKTSIRKRRAKSVEPEKKRRGSIESSYSRKSLSKVGLLKKLKQFHMPFVKSQSKKSVTETSSAKIQIEPHKETPKLRMQNKEQKPVYIHIPLKPPEGQQDEFSHLEFETAPPPRPTNESNDTIETNEDNIESPIDTPQTAKSPQFIVLTPPSDDELLDKPDIPDTPSSETGSLFQFGELKQLAKKAVDQILESVDEEAEQKTEKSTVITEAVVEIQNVGESKDTQYEKEGEDTDNGEKVTIDEEDGLKSMPVAIDDVTSKLKSNLKGDGSPLPKKKVSFKRRKSSQISQVSKDDGYEEIESPSAASVNGETSVGISDAYVSGTDINDSASADEDEPDLDTARLAKGASLEEDRNRWSKISDHEYEPINPPPGEETGTAPPKSHVSEVLNPPSVQTNQYSDDELDLSVQEMQSNIENRFFGSNRNTNPAAIRSVETRTSPNRKSLSKRSSRSRSKEKEPTRPGRLQTALKDSATKFKTKLQGIKKPNISLPSRPKFQKPNFKKPNINLPKLPDLSSTFRRTPKQEEGKLAETEATETKATKAKTIESKAMENSGSKGIFDFSTYPRIFKKKQRDHDSTSLRGDETEKVEKTRKVRSSGAPDIIRIPLHSEASMDQDNGMYPQPEEILEIGQLETEDASSPSGYQEDIETDDEDVLQRERQEKHRAAIAAASEAGDSRWDHGSFYRSHNGTEEHNDNVEESQQEEVELRQEERELQQQESEEEEEIYEREENQPEMVTDLDLPEETQMPFVPMRQKGRLQQNDSFDTNHSKDVGSSVSSLGQHRRGVLEEIDSDQFFLREKGISQDNIDMGKYLSTEIREAFRSPTNALADMHSYNYQELRASNQSLPETKRKPVKKPKRRKTPHTSRERLRYEPESENEDYNFMPPIRPKRKSKRRKRPESEATPFVETILLDPPESTEYSRAQEDDRFHNDESHHYENDQMEGIEQPQINISETYGQHRLHVVDQHDAHRRASEPIPAAPPRKHKSLKSLNASEHESIFEEYERKNENNTLNGFENEDIFMPSEMGQTQHLNHPQFQQEPPNPPKPPTRSRSKTRSMSRTTSQADRDSILGRMDSIMFDEEFREPVVEEPCIKDLRDAMGYAIVDKNQNKNWEHRCCTVPRSQGTSQPPERPLRNYSTLGPSRPERKLSRNMTDEEKENIEVDISQYIEIEDERDLHSGEVIQKIQNRPLPAPPRPPRSRSKPLNEITSRSNIEIDTAGDLHEKEHHIVETEVSTQTEPLPSDFVCEEMVQEETDKIMTPSALRRNDPQKVSDGEPPIESVKVERILITPTQYSYQEETITHGQLLVEPFNGARILPDSEMTRERIIPITSDEEEISEVPEHFNKLSDQKIHLQTESAPEEISETTENFHELSNPEGTISSQSENTDFRCETEDDQKTNSEAINEVNSARILDSSSQTSTDKQEHEQTCSDGKEPQRPPRISPLKTESVDVLKTQKLQVSDLDVDRLTVNELVANKIVVSEIDSGIISSHEISSKSGTLKLADLELQPDVIRKLLEQLQESSRQQQSILGENKPDVSSDDSWVEEKKTSTNFRVLETSVSQDSTVPLAEEDRISSSSQNLTIKDNPTLKNEEISLENVDQSVLSDYICEVQNIKEHELASNENNVYNTSNYKHLSEVDADLKNEDIISDIEDSAVIDAELTQEQIKLLAEESSVSTSAERNIMKNENIIAEKNNYANEIPTSNSEYTAQVETISNNDDVSTLKEENVSDVDGTDTLQEQSKIEEPPVRPPRIVEKKPKSTEEQEQHLESISADCVETLELADIPKPLQLLEPDVDDEPPPRPPQPQIPYIPSQPPASFYALRAHHYVEDLPDDIPLVPRRKRLHRPTTTVSKSSSSESSSVPAPRRRVRSPDPSIPQLTGQLVGACSNVARNRLKRLIDEINSKISSDPDADTNKQNVQVIMVILLVLILGLLLLGYGDGRTVHLHHWEFFNPPTDI